MTAIGDIADKEGILNACWSLCQHHGAAAFRLSEWSPVPSEWSVKNLPGEWTQVIYVRLNSRIDRHPVENDKDSTGEWIFRTKIWLYWNGNLDNQIDREDDSVADVEPNPEQHNGIKEPESPK